MAQECGKVLIHLSTKLQSSFFFFFIYVNFVLIWYQLARIFIFVIRAFPSRIILSAAGYRPLQLVVTCLGKIKIKTKQTVFFYPTLLVACLSSIVTHCQMCNLANPTYTCSLCERKATALVVSPFLSFVFYCTLESQTCSHNHTQAKWSAKPRNISFFFL